MAGYMGDFDPGDTIHTSFNTRGVDLAPITLAGSPAVRVYKDDGTAEDDSGITLNVDHDSRTGLHVVEIDTSTDGTFYSAGSDYRVIITSGTVDSISVVGVCVGEFSIQNRAFRTEIGEIATAAAAAATFEEFHAGLYISDSGQTAATAVAGSLVKEIIDAVIAGLPTAENNADAVLDAAAADHNEVDSIGAYIAAAASAGDPWITTLPGSYTANQAGHIIGNLLATLNSAHGSGSWATADLSATLANLLSIQGTLTTHGNALVALDGKITTIDGIVDNILLDTAVIDTLNTEIGALGVIAEAIQAKTDNLPDEEVTTAVAEALLDLADGIETGVTLRQAIRVIAAKAAGDLSGALTNEVTIKAMDNSATTRLVYAVNSTTKDYTVTITA